MLTLAAMLGWIGLIVLWLAPRWSVLAAIAALMAGLFASAIVTAARGAGADFATVLISGSLASAVTSLALFAAAGAALVWLRKRAKRPAQLA